jgi:hypothetical protein
MVYSGGDPCLARLLLILIVAVVTGAVILLVIHLKNMAGGKRLL